jgi:hypothetical protein
MENFIEKIIDEKKVGRGRKYLTSTRQDCEALDTKPVIIGRFRTCAVHEKQISILLWLSLGSD